MGNTITTSSNCFRPVDRPVKLVFHGGATRTLSGSKHLAGEIMFEFPDRMVCAADSFFLGHPIPSLAIEDVLVKGRTYFLLPLDRFASGVLSASSLAALGSDPDNSRVGPVRFNGCPFEYTKGPDGRALIKVTPEFITRLISREIKEIDNEISDANSFLCNTPELQKHYNQLVGSKDQIWSPKLETISEYKIRFSPCRFVGLEWKQKEVES
ncbi:hypothetical protein ACS0TY_005334 [Phlomoides rotata]